MKMKKKYKILLTLLAIIIVILIGLCIHKLLLNKPKEEKNITNVATVTNKIEGYNYTLDDRDTELFETIFQDLKKNLEGNKMDEEQYAKNLAELFVIDLYTLNNKVSKYDIGGLEYMYEGTLNSFRSKALDAIYKTVEDDSYKTRTQELPIVKSIESSTPKKVNYQMEGQTQSGYEINVKWTYEKDLGYDTSGTIIMIKEENKLSIVSFNNTK